MEGRREWREEGRADFVPHGRMFFVGVVAAAAAAASDGDN